MARFRPVLTLILVLLTVVLASCGGPKVAAKPPTYTTAQIELIQQYTNSILNDRRRMEKELTAEVENQDWSDVSSLIHGPLGEIRQQMNNLARDLLPKEAKTEARRVTKDFFADLVKIDEAAQQQDSAAALSAYKASLKDLDKFLDITVNALEGAKVS